MTQFIQTLINDIAALQAAMARTPHKTEVEYGVEIITDKRALQLNSMQGALSGAQAELKEAQDEATKLHSERVTY